MEKGRQPKRSEEDVKENIMETGQGKEHLVAKQDTSIDSEKLRAIALLQRLVKGRNEQNKMYEGREKRRDLIKELKASEEVKRDADKDTSLIIDD